MFFFLPVGVEYRANRYPVGTFTFMGICVAVHFDGEQSGPFTPGQILATFAARQIPPDALYWQDGMDDWRPAEELRQPGCG